LNHDAGPERKEGKLTDM